MKEYQSNSQAGFYTKWILIFIYYFSWPGAGSRSRNFDIPAPAPAKSLGSLRLRLHNTDDICFMKYRIKIVSKNLETGQEHFTEKKSLIE